MAEVNVKIKAQNQTRTGFQQALGDAQRFGASASGSLKSAFAGVASDIKSSIGGALAGLASIGAIKSIIDQFGRIQDLSEQFGVSAESLQRFGQLASEGGSSVEQIAAAFSKLTINIQKAQGGTGAQADALRELGLSAKELSNLSPEQAFLRLANAVQKGGGSNASYAAALDLIGARQRDLIPLLAQGADAISAQASAVDVASAETVAKVDAMGDSFSRLGQQIAVGLGPAAALIGQVFLTAFAIVEANVQKVASIITSVFAGAGQAMSGDFSAAAATIRQELQSTASGASDLGAKISSIWSTPPEKKGKGAAFGAMEDEESDKNSKAAADAQRRATQDASTRTQVGEQIKSNRRTNLTPEELLASLRDEERFLGGDRGGVSAKELKRLQVVAQIEQLEKQIAATQEQAAEKAADEAQRDQQNRQRAIKDAQRTFEDRAFEAMSPIDRQAELDRQLAQLESGIASGSLSTQQQSQQAARLMQLFDQTAQVSGSEAKAAVEQMMGELQPAINSGAITQKEVDQRRAALLSSLDAQNNFQGSAGASAFQRIGFASNEFFDTRTKPDPTKDTKRAADFAKQIYEILKKGEPLVLANTNS